jgi:hypothetical protein
LDLLKFKDLLDWFDLLDKLDLLPVFFPLPKTLSLSPPIISTSSESSSKILTDFLALIFGSGLLTVQKQSRLKVLHRSQDQLFPASFLHPIPALKQAVQLKRKISRKIFRLKKPKSRSPFLISQFKIPSLGSLRFLIPRFWHIRAAFF